MEKNKGLGIGNTLLISIITAVAILAAMVISSVLYYFTKCLSAVEVGAFYNVMVRFIDIAFTICVMILMAEAMHTILHKTVMSREFEKKQNPKYVKFAYWFILAVVSVVIMWSFKTFLPVFDVYALFLILAIVKIVQVMSKYTFKKFNVQKEEKALLYLIYAIIMVIVFITQYFAIGSYLKPTFLQKINESNEFYKVTKTIEEKVEAKDIEGARRYAAWVSAKTDNKLVKMYSDIFAQLPEQVSEEQTLALEESISTVSDTAKYNSSVLETDANEIKFSRALLSEALIILLLSISAFIVACEYENNVIKLANAKAVKAEKAADKKSKTAKVEKEETVKKETAKKQPVKKAATKKVSKK